MASATGKPAEGRQGTRAEAWLIPPFASPDGKDSLGRGLDNGSVAAAVAANGAVQRERGARWSYLQGAYRDPYAARAALDELEDEARDILRSALNRESARPGNLAASIRARFSRLGGVELPVVPREPMREPPSFGP